MICWVNGFWHLYSLPQAGPNIAMQATSCITNRSLALRVPMHAALWKVTYQMDPWHLENQCISAHELESEHRLWQYKCSPLSWHAASLSLQLECADGSLGCLGASASQTSSSTGSCEPRSARLDRIACELSIVSNRAWHSHFGSDLQTHLHSSDPSSHCPRAPWLSWMPSRPGQEPNPRNN